MDNTNPPAAVDAPEAPKTEATSPAQNGGEASSPNAEENSSNMSRGTTLDAEQVAGFLGTDKATLEKFQKFVDANGQFDKAFDKMRQTISNPDKPAQPAAQPAQPAQQPAQQPTQPIQPQVPAAPEVPEGFVSPQALQVKGYFDKLAADPKYANIAEQISSGDILKEMAAFGMAPVDNNFNINVNQLTKFLDLKSASVPAKPATTEVTTTPTADYTPVEGEITSVDQAWQVLRENVMYTSQGKAPNPALAQAEDYLKKTGAFGPVSPTQPTK